MSSCARPTRRPGRAADELISYVTDDTIAAAQKVFARMDSVGQQRMAQLHGGRRDKLEISPTCGPASAWCAAAPARRWSAIRRPSRRGCKEYQALGIDTFILSGYPHLEEAYRFAELVFPLAASSQQRDNVTALARQHRAVRRDHRQRASAARQAGGAVMSLVDSLARPRSWRLPQPTG